MDPNKELNSAKLSSPSAHRRALGYDDTYVCPVCRHGQLSALTLMDAFACNFCRHIFSANLAEQTIRVEDSTQPMLWRWNGRNWQPATLIDLDVSLLIWFVGVVLVVLPASLIGISSYLFPPLPDSSWLWFPPVWIGLTLGCHLLMVAWVLLEHYQLPLYVSCKIRFQDWLNRA